LVSTSCRWSFFLRSLFSVDKVLLGWCAFLSSFSHGLSSFAFFMNVSVESFLHLRPTFFMHLPIARHFAGFGQVGQGLNALFIPPFLPEVIGFFLGIGFLFPYIMLKSFICVYENISFCHTLNTSYLFRTSVTPDCRFRPMVYVNESAFSFLIHSDSFKA
jgi:hypothetical protein